MDLVVDDDSLIQRHQQKRDSRSKWKYMRRVIVILAVCCCGIDFLSVIKFVSETLSGKDGASSLINEDTILQFNNNFDEGEIFQGRDSFFKNNNTNEDSNLKLPRVLAFVFPQYHPDPLNDALWGQNFTDWDSLKSSPIKNRLGYEIPHPLDRIYYDYRDKDIRTKHGQWAKQYNLDGLIFHHYWFYDDSHPGPNLEAPLLNLLKDGEPDVPFALHWCASKWTATWTSANLKMPENIPSDGVLQLQRFPKDPKSENITQHYQFLRQFFHHKNYIKVDGKPLFMMYEKKPGSFLVLRRFNELAKEDGFPNGLYFTVGLTKPHEHLLDIGPVKNWSPQPQRMHIALSKGVFEKVLSYPNPTAWGMNRTLTIPSWCNANQTEHERVRDMAGIIISFDNTPRRGIDKANIWTPGGPKNVTLQFRKNLHAAIYYETCCFPESTNDDSRFVVINAMNEWAEGMALEPSTVYGYQFLETIQSVKQSILQNGCDHNSLDININISS